MWTANHTFSGHFVIGGLSFDAHQHILAAGVPMDVQPPVARLVRISETQRKSISLSALLEIVG